jgi:hypothetical protein
MLGGKSRRKKAGRENAKGVSRGGGGTARCPAREVLRFPVARDKAWG